MEVIHELRRQWQQFRKREIIPAVAYLGYDEMADYLLFAREVSGLAPLKTQQQIFMGMEIYETNHPGVHVHEGVV